MPPHLPLTRHASTPASAVVHQDDPFMNAVLAATDPSTGETLPWNYDPAVLASLIVFLVVAMALFAWNAYALHRTLAIRNRDKKAANRASRVHVPAVAQSGTPATATPAAAAPQGTIRRAAKSRAPGTPWWTKVRLAKLQLFAAAMHVANQANFLVQVLGRDMDCPWIGSTSGVLYALMILPSCSVLILRSTMLVQGPRRVAYRWLLFALVIIAMVLIAASNALRTWDSDLLAVGVCQANYDRKLNVAGKAALVLSYLIILLVFLRPMIKHIVSMRKMLTPGMQRDEQSRRLEAVVLMLLVKIVLAILLVAIGSILGLFHVFGRFFAVQFSLENLGTVYASTLALERIRATRTGSSGESMTASNTGGVGAVATNTSTVSWSNSVARRPGDGTPQLGPMTELFPLPSPRAGPAAMIAPRGSMSAAEAAATVAKLLGPAAASEDEKARSAASGQYLAPAALSEGTTRVPSAESSSPSSSLGVAAGTMVASAATFGGHQLDAEQFPQQAQQSLPPLRAFADEIDDDARMRRIASGVWIDDEDELDESESDDDDDDAPLHAHASDPEYFQTAYSTRPDVWSTAPEFAGIDAAAHARRPTVDDDDQEDEGEEDVTEARRVRRPLTRLR
ncbi:hypothetical protein AMAG_10496 [Allomyces macrogynus ATCC 38327]|uniref:Uncharacterized protein n=1 Tax=Allomyces macrogynus (strain ATCC 38327) TaxID=578462 RepID=A0A0L0SV86_ALLM3|nr:hypothetical protein AMAG_10496 [Allomyces macrogynus ATCC 38327]|eukprot:KNE66259.1 hypothetical protein AMAG_10496 [Allomyces macrogynus ATCC 38327]